MLSSVIQVLLEAISGSSTSSMYSLIPGILKKLKVGEFDLLVCAGVNAVKWYANLHPEEDKAAIQILMDCLSTVKAKHFIHFHD